MEDKKICTFQNLCWLYGITNDKKIIVEPFIFNFNGDKIKLLISDKIIKVKPSENTVYGLKEIFNILYMGIEMTAHMGVKMVEEKNSICLKTNNENLFDYKFNPIKIYTLQEIKDITKKMKHQLEEYAKDYYKVVGENVKVKEHSEYIHNVEKDTFNF